MTEGNLFFPYRQSVSGQKGSEDFLNLLVDLPLWGGGVHFGTFSLDEFAFIVGGKLMRRRFSLRRMDSQSTTI